MKNYRANQQTWKSSSGDCVASAGVCLYRLYNLIIRISPQIKAASSNYHLWPSIKRRYTRAKYISYTVYILLRSWSGIPAASGAPGWMSPSEHPSTTPLTMIDRTHQKFSLPRSAPNGTKRMRCFELKKR